MGVSPGLGKACTTVTGAFSSAQPGRSTSGQSTSGPPGWFQAAGSYRAVGRPGALQADRLRPACPALSGGVGGRAARGCLVSLHPGTSRLQTPPASRRSTACQRAGHPGSRRLYVERHQMVCYETVWSENSCGFLVPGRTGEAAEEGSREAQLGQQAGLCSTPPRVGLGASLSLRLNGNRIFPEKCPVWSHALPESLGRGTQEHADKNGGRPHPICRGKRLGEGAGVGPKQGLALSRSQ